VSTAVEPGQAPSPSTPAGRTGDTARRGPGGILVVAALVSVATVGASLAMAATVLPLTTPGAWRLAIGGVLALLVLAALATVWPVLKGLRFRSDARRAVAEGDAVWARIADHRSRHQAMMALGCCLPVLILVALVVFLVANDRAVQRTFFDAAFMAQSAGDVTRAFGRNIMLAVLAEGIVLVWGLVVAVARLAPGSAGRPIRWLATAYVDAFRAVPAIIVIYLLGFGLPLAGFPVLSDLSPFWAAVLALSLTYGAYVAEVYRAGIESIHWSQTSAARSLGLSHGKTLRFVVVPQAVKRVTPPLLNDFIGLQKDTALVTVIGTVDAFTQSKTYASNYFNLSSVTVVALLFILITIPQTRFVDRLLDKDRQRQRALG
jgi:polar amino acid transport system permease protein